MKHNVFSRVMLIVLGLCISQTGLVNAAAKSGDSKRTGVIAWLKAKLSRTHPAAAEITSPGRDDGDSKRAGGAGTTVKSSVEPNVEAAGPAEIKVPAAGSGDSKRAGAPGVHLKSLDEVIKEAENNRMGRTGLFSARSAEDVEKFLSGVRECDRSAVVMYKTPAWGGCTVLFFVQSAEVARALIAAVAGDENRRKFIMSPNRLGSTVLSVVKSAEVAKALIDGLPTEKDRCEFIMSGDQHGHTALCFIESVDIVKVLIDGLPTKKQRCDFIMSRDRDGNTALFYAKSADIAKLLLDEIPKGEGLAFIMSKNRYGQTMLYGTSRADVAKLLLDEIPEGERRAFIMNTDKDRQTAIFKARKAAIVTAILDGLSPVDRVSMINLQDNNENTAMHEYCSRGRGQSEGALTTLLAEPGCDITIRNKEGKTARDINPGVFDDCARAANEIIKKKNAEIRQTNEARKTEAVDALVALGMSRDAANLTAEYDAEPEQPLVPVGPAAPAPAAPAAAAPGTDD